jgi:hypothetical protein
MDLIYLDHFKGLQYLTFKHISQSQNHLLNFHPNSFFHTLEAKLRAFLFFCPPSAKDFLSHFVSSGNATLASSFAFDLMRCDQSCWISEAMANPFIWILFIESRSFIPTGHFPQTGGDNIQKRLEFQGYPNALSD